jgi:hypothetical protein
MLSCAFEIRKGVSNEKLKELGWKIEIILTQGLKTIV